MHFVISVVNGLFSTLFNTKKKCFSLEEISISKKKSTTVTTSIAKIQPVSKQRSTYPVTKGAC